MRILPRQWSVGSWVSGRTLSRGLDSAAREGAGARSQGQNPPSAYTEEDVLL